MKKGHGLVVKMKKDQTMKLFMDNYEVKITTITMGGKSIELLVDAHEDIVIERPKKEGERSESSEV